MKLKMKALAAAALVASAGASHALIQLPSTGNGELILVAYDPVLNFTYLQDLGTLIQQFNGTATNGSITLGGWNTFMGNIGADTSNVRWGVLAGDGLAPISTYFTATTRVGNATGTMNPAQSRISAINTAISSISNAWNSLPAFGSNTGTFDQNGWGIVDGTFSAQFSGLSAIGPGENLNSNTSLKVVGTLQQDLYFYAFTSGTSLGSTRTGYGNALGQGQWKLDEVTGTLQYTAPVPEPGTYALMLAGLLTLGAVARRRTK